MNDTNAEELTPKQDQLIELLLAGVNISAAARQLKIGNKTAYRWLKLNHFQTAYKTAQRALFDQALTGLLGKVDKAIETLDRNMSAPEAVASTQVRAAQIILEQAIGIYKVGELETKVAELEQLLRGEPRV